MGRLSLAATLLLSGTGCGFITATHQYVGPVQITNHTGLDLCHLEVLDDGPSHRIVEGQLPNDGTIEVDHPRAGRMELVAMDCEQRFAMHSLQRGVVVDRLELLSDEAYTEQEESPRDRQQGHLRARDEIWTVSEWVQDFSRKIDGPAPADPELRAEAAEAIDQQRSRFGEAEAARVAGAWMMERQPDTGVLRGRLLPVLVGYRSRTWGCHIVEVVLFQAHDGSSFSGPLRYYDYWAKAQVPCPFVEAMARGGEDEAVVD